MAESFRGRLEAAGLMESKRPAPPAAAALTSVTTPYGAATIRSQTDTVRSTLQGRRNAQLNIAALKIGHYVAGGEIARADAEAALTEAALAAGLEPAEIRGTIASGLTAGMREPRSAPSKSPTTSSSGYADLPPLEDIPWPNDEQATAVAGPRESLRSRLLRRDQLGDLPQPEPIIENTLDARTVVVLSGRNSTGKSFLALDWSNCVATGKPWQGREVLLPGPVLYVAAEGAHGLEQRVSAWEYAWAKKVIDLDVLPVAVNLFSGKGFAELQEIVIEKTYRLVVIDTWARSTVGGKENDNSDSTASFERADQLRTTGTTVLIVAHTDAADNKTRGATALDDNADTLYRIKGDPLLLELRREKRKDGPRDDFHQLRLMPVLDSCVIENVRGQDQLLSGRADELLSAYKECFADTGCSKAELRNVANQPSATFARSLKSLLDQRVLENLGTDIRPFYKPGASYAR